jgi:hypothetical protein
MFLPGGRGTTIRHKEKLRSGGNGVRFLADERYISGDPPNVIQCVPSSYLGENRSGVQPGPCESYTDVNKA